VSAFIDERREDFGVEPICSVLGVSASAYYQRATGERSPRAVEDERLVPVIRECQRICVGMIESERHVYENAGPHRVGGAGLRRYRAE
jgi:hypothetical protein